MTYKYESSMYKYESPYDWLMSHVDKIISTAQNNLEGGDPDAMFDTTNQLRSIISTLAIKHDSDTIQDEFQSDMDADGYFDEVE